MGCDPPGSRITVGNLAGQGLLLQGMAEGIRAEGLQDEWRRRSEMSDVKLDAKEPLMQIAPQLHVTDRHLRMFLRQLTQRSQLWTEMVVDTTIVHSEHLDHHIGHDPREHPLVIQLGGASSVNMAMAIRKIWSVTRFEEVNLNVGCPSHRVVAKGSFGACLMKKPDLVAEICGALRESVAASIGSANAPNVTVKTRIGVDQQVGGNWLRDTIEQMGASGVRTFCMHARPAILGMNITPSQNRTIPVLNYDSVFELEEKLGDRGYRFSLNGGIQSVATALDLLRTPSAWDDSKSALRGVMIGRRSTDDPCMLSTVDTAIYGEKHAPATAFSRATVLQGYMSYLDEFLRLEESDDSLPASPFLLVRPVCGLFYATSGSRHHRQTLDKAMREVTGARAAIEVLNKLYTSLEEHCAETLHAPLP